jgi:hypothetical protein
LRLGALGLWRYFSAHLLGYEHIKVEYLCRPAHLSFDERGAQLLAHLFAWMRHSPSIQL